MARLLHDRGYQDVRPLLGGFDGWVQLGFPVVPHTEAAAHLPTPSAIPKG